MILVAACVVATGGVVTAAGEAISLSNSHRQLASAHQELSQFQKELSHLQKELNKSQMAVRRATAKVVSVTQQLNLLESTTTTTSPAATFVVTDPQLLVSTLDAVSQQLTGFAPPEGQAQEFVTQFQAAQVNNEQLQYEGLPSVALDPTAEAEAFIKVHDVSAVYAYRATQLKQALDCLLAPGMPQCSGQNSP